MIVEHHDAVVGDQAALDDQALVLLDGGDLVRADIRGHLVLPGAQAVRPGRSFGDFHDADGGQRWTAAPPGVMRLQHQLDVGAEGDELVGAGADGAAGGGLPAHGLVGSGADDLAAAGRQAAL